MQSQMTPRPRLTVDDLKPAIEELVQDADAWLDTENDRLGGLKPRDVIQAGGGHIVKGILDSASHGLYG